MTVALVFRDSEALEVVLRSGICAPEVMAKAAKVAHGDAGSLILAPEKPLTGAALQKLRAAGVSVDGELPRDAREVRCWAEAVQPVRTPLAEIPSLVLFATPEHVALVDLAAELVRLGCDRLELCPEHGLVRVVDPPTYTVVRALDHEAGLGVFAPDPAGQETIWTELGYRHALATHLSVDPDHLLLIPGAPLSEGQSPKSKAQRPATWRAIRATAWLPLDAALELRVPGDDRALAPSKLSGKRKVDLRLGTGRREAPSLWVIRQDAIATVDKLLAYLPEDVVARLAFAATGGEAPTILLRARTSRHAPPDLSIAAEEYAPLAQMPDVFAPASAIVEPPLRRERLRSIIGVESGEVVWLARTDGDKFRVERTTDAAFAPLSEWADYIVHASAPALVPWMRATAFEFSPFVSTGLEWASERPAAAPEEPDEAAKKKARGRTRVDAPAPAPALQTPRPQPQPQPSSSSKLAGEVPVAAIPIDQELAALEAEFIALDAPGDAPERLALLERLGNVYARLGRRRDAGLCYARSVWESTGADAAARLDGWIAAHSAGHGDPAAELSRALAAKEPDSDDARLVAALAAAAHPAVRQDPHRVTRWLDDHDLDLDARTLWLARLGLASLSGGDPLGLAHARDRILARLAGGLPVERELPAFLRFAGRSGALGNASGEHLGTALDELAQKLDKTRRKRSPVEAPAAYTNAYVGFLLAHGFARIGKHERARAIVEDSRKALAPVIGDAVHAYLSAAYGARVDQAIAGLPSETPLPEPLGSQLAALDRVTRYKVDRLREASRILEPLERPDAIGNYSRQIVDSRGPEFAALRTLTDPAARANALGKLITTANANEQDRERLLDGVLDFLLEVPVNLALPLLARAWPIVADVAPPRRALLYAEALVVAGHFGNTELVPELLDALATALRAVSGSDLERTLQHSLRALRRIGLRVETANLLTRAEHALPQTRNIEGLRARLALAAGLAYLGESERARPIFEQARGALNDNLKLVDRLELVRALALAYAQMPLQAALGGIGELVQQFRDITDSYGTNSHYCLAVLHFVESLVLGITSDDLALGEAGRRFVEDDEHLIRRRLHLDLKGPK